MIDYLCFTANDKNSTVKLVSVEKAPAIELYYSTNKIVWDRYIVDDTEIILENAGDKVYFKGNNFQFATASARNFHKFVLTGKLNVSGDLTTLLSENGGIEDLSNFGQYTFCNLFLNCESLIEANITLPSMILQNSCYWGMFGNCKNLVSIPELPATTLAEGCYFGMFSNCASLKNSISLPATDLSENCYGGMFLGCTSLNSIPELSAKSLVDNCYSCMFAGCTNIVLTETPIVGLSKIYKFGSAPNIQFAESMFAETSGNIDETPTLQSYYTCNLIIE